MMASSTDRLSDLPDGVLGSILSRLPTKEAARAAVLCRRWRRAFAEVDALSFIDHEAVIANRDEDCTFYLESSEQRSRNGDLIEDVNAALLCRRRCAGHRHTGPPRSFRVHFALYNDWDEAMVNQWLRYLLKPRQEELIHLDLRLRATLTGEYLVDQPKLRGYDDDDECPLRSRYEAHRYTLPTRLFSCAALRTLCLGACVLDPPQLIHLPLLETLLLSSISYPGCGDEIQRLVDSCPLLVDLTMDRCGYTEKDEYYYNIPKYPGLDKSYTIRVLDKHLRRLAIRCCHNLVRASVDASELRVLEYRGAVPAESSLTLHGANKISSCTIGFCGREVWELDLPRFRKFMEQLACTRHLNLASTRLGAGIERESFPGFPSFPNLVRLELTGYVERGGIEAMIRILEQAPSVEFLSVFMKPSYSESSASVLVHPDELGDEFTVSDGSVPCLRDRVREINLVHYQGHETQRNVAKLLLCNAMVLEQVCVVFPRGPRELQTKLAREIEGWMVNKSANKIFL